MRKSQGLGWISKPAFKKGQSVRVFATATALAGMAVAIVGTASAHDASATVTLPAAKATFVMNNESKPCNNWGRYAWAEGAGQNGCVGSGATWLQTGLGNAWSQPGADFTGDNQAVVAKTAGDSPGRDAFDVTSFAQGWASGAVANDGLLLKLDDESPSPCTTVTNCNYWAYASDDWAEPAFRPTLTITYR